jgi:hypothetical protein
MPSLPESEQRADSTRPAASAAPSRHEEERASPSAKPLLPGECEGGGRDGERRAAGQRAHAVPMQGAGRGGTWQRGCSSSGAGVGSTAVQTLACCVGGDRCRSRLRPISPSGAAAGAEAEGEAAIGRPLKARRRHGDHRRRATPDREHRRGEPDPRGAPAICASTTTASWVPPRRSRSGRNRAARQPRRAESFASASVWKASRRR